MYYYSLLLLLLLLFTIIVPLVQSSFNIVSYGAKPDGQTDSSESLTSAWHAACTSTSSSSTIYVPAGTFLIKPVTFNGPCNTNHIIFQIDGTLIASSSYSSKTQQWIMFEHVNGISIFGGTLDGRGQSLWSCKNSGRGCPDGATVST